MDLQYPIGLSPNEQEFLIENKESLNQLLTVISFAKGFHLAIIQVDAQEDLDAIIKKITTDEKCSQIQFWQLKLNDPELVFFRDEMVKRLADFTIEIEKKLVIIIQGLENAIGLSGEKPNFLYDLNYVRDLLPRDIPYPIIFCLPNYAVNRLANLAPDLWSWISSVVKFNSLEIPVLSRGNETQVRSEIQESIPTGIKDRIDFLNERLSKYYESKDDSVKDLFYLLSELGIAYRQQKNLEKAEIYLHQAEDLYEQNKSLISSTDRGNLFDNLGRLYGSKNKGSIANNLEQAISYYQLALEIYTRDVFPQQWAMTQNNLGNAYRNRIRGNKAENLENAIAAYLLALSVYTKEDFPMKWAMTQNNLANAYRNRIRGNKAENLENAIDAYFLALSVYTKEDFPIDWAMTQNNLGNAYSYRIRGDRAENLENAIFAYLLALSVYTKEDFPMDWAMTQNNLGNAYRNRIRGNKAENLENAIAAYHLALSVYTKEDFPIDWAKIQNNLGNAYRNRIRGNKAENLENAIAAYHLALCVYTKEDFPMDWAKIQNNLAIAYKDRIKDRNLSPENTLKKLQDIAQSLREYRIALRRRVPPLENIENPEIDRTVESIYNPNLEQNQQQTFLQDYTRIIQNCLSISVRKVIQNRVTKLQKSNPPKHQNFLTALKLFYQGFNMAEIVDKIGYEKQYQVSRLLKLKELREDVSQEIIVYLKPQVKELAKYYTSSENLKILEQQLNEILNEEVNKIIQNAKIESIGIKRKNIQVNSLFADAVRKYMNELEIEK